MAKSRIFQDEFSGKEPNLKLLAEMLLTGFLAEKEVNVEKGKELE